MKKNKCENEEIETQGFDFDYEYEEPKKEKSKFGLGVFLGAVVMLAVLLVIYVIFVFSSTFSNVSTTYSGNSYEEKVNLIVQYLKAYYLWELDDEKIEEALAKGLLANIGDKYAMYYTAEEFQELIESQTGEYAGIGISIVENDDGNIEVYKVFADSPAEAAGVHAKDIIVEAAGSTDFKTIDDVAALVRGEIGTIVNVKVKRGDEEISFDIERQNIVMQFVDYEMKTEEIGYIYLSEFNQASAAQFEEAIEDLKTQGMKKLIIDLRNNPGGDYDSVVEMADYILPEGIIISTKDKNGNEKTEYSDAERYLDMPMVVIVNEYSASASELFTGALQDYKVATVVGTQSYGKGIVQSIYRFNDGSGVKFTTEEYFTPSGRSINGVGITPDVVAEFSEEAYADGVISEEEDIQMQTAMEVIAAK